MLPSDFIIIFYSFFEFRWSKGREEIIDGIKPNNFSIELFDRFLSLCQQVRIQVIFPVLFVLLHEKFIKVRRLFTHIFPKSYIKLSFIVLTIVITFYFEFFIYFSDFSIDCADVMQEELDLVDEWVYFRDVLVANID